jgi:hypothetical protein
MASAALQQSLFLVKLEALEYAIELDISATERTSVWGERDFAA